MLYMFHTGSSTWGVVGLQWPHTGSSHCHHLHIFIDLKFSVYYTSMFQIIKNIVVFFKTPKLICCILLSCPCVMVLQICINWQSFTRMAKVPQKFLFQLWEGVPSHVTTCTQTYQISSFFPSAKSLRLITIFLTASSHLLAEACYTPWLCSPSFAHPCI